MAFYTQVSMQATPTSDTHEHFWRTFYASEQQRQTMNFKSLFTVQHLQAKYYNCNNLQWESSLNIKNFQYEFATRIYKIDLQ